MAKTFSQKFLAKLCFPQKIPLPMRKINFAKFTVAKYGKVKFLLPYYLSKAFCLIDVFSNKS